MNAAEGPLLPDGANRAVRSTELEIDLAEVPAEETLAGTPVQGFVELGQIGDASLGIWELRGGTVTDTEVDECFVVLSGSAVITLLDEQDENGVPRVVEVHPGDVMRLTAGSRTKWAVTDHIRKVYISADS
ncbi:MAG: cupin domain-containing protein [Leucobacter sp.]